MDTWTFDIPGYLIDQCWCIYIVLDDLDMAAVCTPSRGLFEVEFQWKKKNLLAWWLLKQKKARPGRPTKYRLLPVNWARILMNAPKKYNHHRWVIFEATLLPLNYKSSSKIRVHNYYIVHRIKFHYREHDYTCAPSVQHWHYLFIASLGRTW